jgi:hypothetical protein
MKEKKKNMGWQNDTGKLKRRDQVASKLTLEHILWQCKETEEERRKSNIKYGRKESRSKNADRVCEEHWIILRTIDNQGPHRNEKRTNKKRRRKPQMGLEKDNEDRQRILELNVKVKSKM